MKISNMTVIIMCKAPVVGRVKTRLMPEFSADRAAALHAAMATTVIKRAKRLFASVVIAADDPKHPFFTPFALPVIAQGEGSLGDRMQRQVNRLFDDGAGSVMLLGTDSPHMSEQRLLEAARAVLDHDVVIGPVEDGGYDLLAINAAYPLFDEISWSTAQVLAQSLQKAEALHCSIRLLDVSFDVDLAADLVRAEASGWHRVS